MTAVSYHDTVNDLQGPAWSADGPFARLDWFRLIETGSDEPLLAIAVSDEDAVCLPLAVSKDGVTSLSNWYAFTWSPVHTGPQPHDRLLTAIAADLAKRTSRVSLGKLSAADCDLLRTTFRKSGWMTFASPCDTNHILRLDSRDYRQYLESRPGRLRTTLKRKAKKVEVRISTVFSADDWAAYEDIYANSWKSEEGDPALLRRFAENESAAGRYRFGIALHEGCPVAAQFWTVEGGCAYIHKLAHRESAKPISPGTTVTAALFEHVIEKDGVELVDFGTGDDPYKRDWMEEKRTRWQLDCLRPGVASNWPRIVKALIRELVSRNRSG